MVSCCKCALPNINPTTSLPPLYSQAQNAIVDHLQQIARCRGQTHTHTKKTCFYLWRDSSFRKLLPSKPISLSIEKVWCMGIKLTACLLIIEPFANCYGLNRGGIGHEERGAFSHLEVRNLLAGCHLSYNGKTRSKTWFHTDYKTEKSVR